MKKHFEMTASKTACGRAIIRPWANSYRPLIQIYSTWDLVDCSQCLAKKPVAREAAAKRGNQ